MWQVEGVPHLGWTILKVLDLKEAKGECDMCAKEALRFVYTMQHLEYPQALEVGSSCAEKMSTNYVHGEALKRDIVNSISRAKREAQREVERQAAREVARERDRIAEISFLDYMRSNILSEAIFQVSAKGNKYFNFRNSNIGYLEKQGQFVAWCDRKTIGEWATKMEALEGIVKHMQNIKLLKEDVK